MVDETPRRTPAATAGPPARDTDRPAAVTVRVPIDRELPLQRGGSGRLAWRYAYARSADCQRSEQVGQDYLTFRADEQTVAFALCDGIGQSFFGDVAAGLVGDTLLDWLWADSPTGESVEALGTGLDAMLQALTVAGTTAVQEYVVSDELAPVVAQVLERKRARGSATTFTGGWVRRFPDGAVGGLLVALGDSRIRRWSHGVEQPVHPAEAQRGHGWSTRDGVIGGPPSVVAFSVPSGDVRILAYSDGLVALDTATIPLSDVDVALMIAGAQREPTSDDIAVFEVWSTGDHEAATALHVHEANGLQPATVTSDVAADCSPMPQPAGAPDGSEHGLGDAPSRSALSVPWPVAAGLVLVVIVVGSILALYPSILRSIWTSGGP